MRAAAWIGTIAQIVGVFMLSSRLGAPWAAYGVMTIGSVIWIVVGCSRRDGSLVALNLVFTACNLIGIWRWS